MLSRTMLIDIDELYDVLSRTMLTDTNNFYGVLSGTTLQAELLFKASNERVIQNHTRTHVCTNTGSQSQ